MFCFATLFNQVMIFLLLLLLEKKVRHTHHGVFSAVSCIENFGWWRQVFRTLQTAGWGFHLQNFTQLPFFNDTVHIRSGNLYLYIRTEVLHHCYNFKLVALMQEALYSSRAQLISNMSLPFLSYWILMPSTWYRPTTPLTVGTFWSDQVLWDHWPKDR